VAKFPKIDSPCPLDSDAQARIAGHCGRCDKSVHRLDGMDEAQRRAFMRQATQPVCVSYRLPVAAAAALALTMAGAVHAGVPEGGATTVQATVQTAAQVLPDQDAAGHVPATTTTTADALKALDDGKPLEILVLGGITRPGDAEWADDDTSLPELPVVHERQSAE